MIDSEARIGFRSADRRTEDDAEVRRRPVWTETPLRPRRPVTSLFGSCPESGACYNSPVPLRACIPNPRSVGPGATHADFGRSSQVATVELSEASIDQLRDVVGTAQAEMASRERQCRNDLWSVLELRVGSKGYKRGDIRKGLMGGLWRLGAGVSDSCPLPCGRPGGQLQELFIWIRTRSRQCLQT